LDERKLVPRFLDFFIRTPGFRNQVEAQGSTNYAAIRPLNVLNYRMPLPPKEEQRRIVARIEALNKQINDARRICEQSDANLTNLLNAAYGRIAGDAPRKLLSEIAPLQRRPVQHEVDESYPRVAVRSFGRGTFHRPALVGSEITWQKLFLVRSGDILISNIKAWEGAVAVAEPCDDGRVGSHRYLTCVPVPGVATARFVCFHLLTPEGLHAIGAASPGSADRNRTLGAKALQKIPIPVPPIDDQLWFDDLCVSVEQVRSLRVDEFRAIDALLPSILNSAFQGEF
jgi:type I restriction enzyme S subunit